MSAFYGLTPLDYISISMDSKSILVLYGFKTQKENKKKMYDAHASVTRLVTYTWHDYYCNICVIMYINSTVSSPGFIGSMVP